MHDPVNHPPHYTSGDIECIEAIREALADGFVDYCRGNAMKYIWRAGLKGPASTDMMKAAWYCERAAEYLEGL